MSQLAASSEDPLALAEEHAALRRVATLVARGATPSEVMQSVSAEVGELLRADAAGIGRYEADGMATALGGWSREGDYPVPIGTRFVLGKGTTGALVFESGMPGRVDTYDDAEGSVAASARNAGWRSAVSAPIVVQGRLWGFASAASTGDLPFPPDSEGRLAAFTELVAIAVSNAAARDDVARLVEEQAALRRVATLVAQGAPAETIFDGVAHEIAQVMGIQLVTIDRYDLDASTTVVASLDPAFPAGSRWPLDGPSLAATVLRTSRAARVDDYTLLNSTVAAVARDHAVNSTVGVPIFVDDAVWGVICVGSRGPDRLPAGTKRRLAAFSEFVETAISNAQGRDDLMASRARIAAAADQTRKRIVRDLRDGIQQQLVVVRSDLDGTREHIPAELGHLNDMLSSISDGLADVFEELGDIGRGIHPAAISGGGLRRALRELSNRSAVPVALDLGAVPPLPEPVAVAAYYVVSEALTNAAKHAHASVVNVAADVSDAQLRLAISDDGIGGADARGGSGLIGMRDRVEALGGTFDVSSPDGGGTALVLALPVASRRGIVGLA
jgi:signal transduction histidine kinase